MPDFPVEDPVVVTDEQDTRRAPADSQWKVVLFNDDIHTFDEVIHQLTLATGCSRGHAETIAWEVHTRGRAIAYTGDCEECIRVSGVLEEIGLQTQIET